MRKLKAPRLTVKAKTGLVLLFIILLTSVLAPVLAPYDPLVSNLSEALQKPSAAHLLGTDNIGRDTLSRVLYGGRQSILLALAATVLSMLLGFVLGLFAGYFGGWIDLQHLPGTSGSDAYDRCGRSSGTGRNEYADCHCDQFLGGFFQDRPWRGHEIKAGELYQGT